nr:SDR family oxidoreductase [Actinomyces sp.]
MTVVPDSPDRLRAEPAAPTALPLAGRVVMVTGVSRRAGIGYAIACRAAQMGASLFLQHFSPHDAAQPWGADDVTSVVDAVRAHLVGQARLAHAAADLSDPAAPAALVAQAVSEMGGLDALVCNHAASGRDGTLAQVTAADLDHHWQVNARSSLLLVQALTEYQRGAERTPRPGLATSVVLMTSGQGEGPMPGEIAYATSKAALAGITPSLAAGAAEDGIRLNTVNPGPVDTGYMSPELLATLTPRFPGGRMPVPADPARLVTWLLTDDAAWVTGQVISTEGGFRRS